MAESTNVWLRRGALALGAGAALALAIQISRSRRRQSSADSATSGGASGAPAVVANGKASPAVASAPVASGGGIAAQRAAALAAAGKESAWIRDPSLPLDQDIERRLRLRYAPTYLDVENHGNNCGALSLAVVMVSKVFEGQSRVQRRQDVHALLAAELDSGQLHALPMTLKTPEEYKKTMAKMNAEGKQ
eukprot:TRINITY_DN15001_c0_g1_i2.p2 TRINITY_DN15001_c0_g1~~TRINITY_DN15001_c0_g1_i2.p2  ORF type:complete len:190 (-),score=49.23 TRINITY_DN15001_c0_g1_i2:173-742(-)